MNIEDNVLVPIAMQIILSAGDAREQAEEALKRAKAFDFTAAYACLAQADKLIAEAHHAQTDVVQKETSGEQTYELNLIFVHAQDTLMTIRSEVKLSRELVGVLELIEDRLADTK